MQISLKKNVDTSLTGVDTILFGAAWSRKTAKQTSAGSALARLTRGKVGVPKPKDVDLDLALVVYRDGEPKRLVVGHNKSPEGLNGTFTHSGDNTTGAGDGDDESIRGLLNQVPAWATEWAVIVAAFKPGTTFDHAQDVSLNVYDDSDRHDGRAVVIDNLMPTLGRGDNATVVATGKRNRGPEGEPLTGWSIRLVDVSGRMTRQGDDTALLEFAKQHAGI